jgi:hypothetical protein
VVPRKKRLSSATSKLSPPEDSHRVAFSSPARRVTTVTRSATMNAE